jgi:linoleate 10R-lipoxygenase
MKKHLANIGVLARYKMPAPPTAPVPRHQSINTFRGVERVLADMRTFKTVYGEPMEYLTNGYGFFLAFDDPARHGPARRMVGHAFSSGGRMEDWVLMYERRARELIKERSWGLTGVRSGGLGGSMYLDVVRDVLNVVPVHWVCEEIVSAFTSLRVSN